MRRSGPEADSKGARAPEGGWTVSNFAAAMTSRSDSAARTFLRLADPLATHWCRALGVPAADADDVVSDAYLRARARSARAVSPEAEALGVSPWVSILVHRAAQDHVRRRGRDARTPTETLFVDQSARFARRATACRERLAVYPRGALNSLTAPQRGVLRLRGEGLSYVTIGRRRGVRWVSVREMAERAWSRLAHQASGAVGGADPARFPSASPGKLGPREAEVWSLRSAGLSIGEMADRLGCTRAAARSAFRRLRRRTLPRA